MTMVLDAWAVLAWVRNEQPAADRVRELLVAQSQGRVDLAMSAINAGEVYYRLCRIKGESFAESFVTELSGRVRRLDVSWRVVSDAARYQCRYRLPYADALAMATAIREKAALVTGDSDFAPFRDGTVVQIEWLGRLDRAS